MKKIQILDKHGRPIRKSAIGYRGASSKRNRLTSSIAGPLMPHYRIMSQYVRERLSSNMKALERNNSTTSSAMTNFHTHVVNVGLKLQCNLNAKSLGISQKQARDKENDIEEKFDVYASSFDADATRQQNLYQLTGTILYEWLGGGDCFALTPFIKDSSRKYGLAVRIVESERVSNPDLMPNNDKFRDGIEVNRFGEPVAIWVRESFPNDSFSGVINTWKRHRIFDSKGRRRANHIWFKKWGSQYRGETKFASVVEDLQYLTGLDKGEITTRFVQSLFSIFITSPYSAEGDMGIEPWDGESEQFDPYQDDDKIILEPALVQELEPGQDVRFADPARNASNYKDFVDALTTRLSAAIGIPIEVLNMKFGDSYSASRAALILAWEVYKVYREILATNLLIPVYQLWLDEAVARGIIELPNYLEKRDLWNRCAFRGTKMPIIDEQKAARAADTRLKSEVTSKREERQQLGLNHDKIEAQRQIEKEGN